jgi:hypothetical protein
MAQIEFAGFGSGQNTTSFSTSLWDKPKRQQPTRKTSGENRVSGSSSSKCRNCFQKINQILKK